MYKEPHLLFVVALPAEARPLLDHFSLKEIDHRGFRLYGNASTRLVLTGIGRMNAAAATAHALSTLPENTLVLNIGIAGSDNPIGNLYYAYSVTDGRKAFYPSTPFAKRIQGINVHTVDQPSEDYLDDTAFDMEASAVIATARKYVTAEFTHSLKVISDNPGEPVFDAERRLNPAVINSDRVTGLIETRIPAIVDYLEAAQKLTGILYDSAAADNKSTRLIATIIDIAHASRLDKSPLHLTVSHRQQLEVLCNRFNVLNLDLPDTIPANDASNARSLIAYLEDFISSTYPDYPLISGS